MNNPYYEAIDQLEKDGVSRDYILGWASAFLGNPKLEEQRLTEAYEAGYDDGSEKTMDKAQNWKG